MKHTVLSQAIAALTAAMVLGGAFATTAQAQTGAARAECSAQTGLNLALDFNVDGTAADIWDTISAKPEGQYKDYNTGWGMCPGRIGVAFQKSKPTTPTGYWDGTFTVKEDLTFDGYVASRLNSGKSEITDLYGYGTSDELEKGDEIPKGTKATFRLQLTGTASTEPSTYLMLSFDNGKSLSNNGMLYVYGATFNFTKTKEKDSYEKHEHKFYRNYGPGDSTVLGTDDDYNDTIDTPSDPERSGYKFTGWYTEREDGTQVEDGDKATDLKLNPDQSFYAQWEKDDSKPVTHTLTFNTDGGSSIPAQTVEDGEAPERPDDPTKSGYIFDGWYVDSTLSREFDFSAPMTADATAYAKWTKSGVSMKDTYTVSFETDGGTSIPDQSVKKGETPSKPSDPTKEGYKFDGWYTSTSYTTEFNFDDPITSNVTVYAKWTKDSTGDGGGSDGGDTGDGSTHTVTYVVNGGTPVVPETVKDGLKLMPPFDPSRPHYAFDGWYTDKGLTTKYDFSAPVKTDLTLYAKWTKDDSQKVWTLTFDSRGGSSVSPVEVIDGDVAVMPKDPTKSGVDFIGWFTDEKLVKPFDKTGPVTASQTLYARWSSDTGGPVEGTHNVLFDSNGGSKVEGQNVRDGARAVKPKNPTKSGSTFAGWYSDKALTKRFDFGSFVTSDLILYAKWSTGKVHTVTFDVADGSGPAPLEVEDGQKIGAVSDPTRYGYKFTKWYSDKDLKTEFDLNTPITKDMTIYAGWVEDKGSSDGGSTGGGSGSGGEGGDTGGSEAVTEVTVTFNAGGGSMSDTRRKVKKGSPIAKPEDPTKKGYVFDGWFADSAFTKKYDFSQPVNSDITIYALWHKEGETVSTHTVTFNTNGGTAVSSQKVKDGDKPTKPADPTRTGFKFNGWYSDEKLTTPYTFTDPVHADFTVYAAWTSMDSPDKPTTHTVTFDTKGGSSIPAQTVEDGSRATSPDTPLRSGYKFDGWYADSSYKKVFDFTLPITKDTTVYAKWTKVPGSGTDTGDGSGSDGSDSGSDGSGTDTDKPDTGDGGSDSDKTTYLIHFNTNGGSTIPDQTVEAGKLPTTPDNPTKDGYTFAGWYTDEALTTPFSFTSQLSSDVTLYAKWSNTKPSFTIDFTVDGQKVDSQTVAEGGKINLSKDPTKDGYKFLGWYTAAEGGDKVTADTPISKDMKLYAHWQAVTPAAKVQQTVDKAQQALANTGVTAPLAGVAGVLLIAGIGFLSVALIRRHQA